MFLEARSFIYQLVGKFFGRLVIRTRPGQRRVLLACHNSMMATYLSEVYDLMKHDPRIVVRLSVKTPEEYEGDEQVCRALFDCKYLKPRISKLLPWDLVIMANHPGVFKDVAKSARKVLRIPHGIGSKLVHGVDYMYNHYCFDDDGKLIYARFFESSFDRQSVAVSQNPQLEGKVGVVGSMRLDRVEAYRRSQIQPSEERPKQVLVISSWGAGNLFDYLQRFDFAEAARSLSGEFIFRLRPHPNLLSAINSDFDSFKEQLAEWEQLDNVELSKPGEKLESDLTECDILLGDDLSSVSLFGVALDMPMAIWKTSHPGVGEGTYLSRLSEILPCLEPGGDLGGVLRRAMEHSHSPARKELACGLRSYPGQAESRARAELYQLLELSEPSSEHA